MLLFWIPTLLWTLTVSSQVGAEAANRTQTVQQTAQPTSAGPPNGAALYARYCAACHGENGEGQVAERANALRSQSFLLTVSATFLDHAIRYGRSGTAMTGYGQTVGGPLTDREISALVSHIQQFARPKFEGTIQGDADRGAQVYETHCQGCHGSKGEGRTAPGLSDPVFLYTTESHFIRYAIAEGRENTVMPPFRHALTAQQLDDVTAYIRSWARPWTQPPPVRIKETDLRGAVLNPDGSQPQLGALRDGRYVSATTLKRLVEVKARLILLDVRPKPAWAGGHIPGAASLPHHDVEQRVGELPQDGTWIVAYCACPTALANGAVNTLRELGFANTAVLDGGLAAWIAKGYALQSAIIEEHDPTHAPPGTRRP